MPPTLPPLRILTFSTLYPNAAQPNHGVFVENRVRHLVGTGRVAASVIAPIPWFPFRHRKFGRYAAFASAPEREVRHSISIEHPRYVVIPRFGMTASPWLMYAGVREFVGRCCRAESIDLIDAHYFYPDGVAAALLAKEFGMPLTITARGTDVNFIPRYALPRRMILWAASRADGLITVCEALRKELIDLGAPPNKIRTLRNGVDLQAFRPLPPEECRAKLGVTGTVLLSVGSLIPRKRHDLVIRALPLLPDATLLIAGDGPERMKLAQLGRELQVGHRVRFLGTLPHDRLPEVYSAADVLILASTREGWANVLLESMACGTPVIATRVWGSPEVVASPAAGRLLEDPTPDALADTVRALLNHPPSRQGTRRYAERFGWDETSRGQFEFFSEILDRRRESTKTADGSADLSPWS